MKKKKPIKILTLDTETYNGLIGDLKRIAIYDGKTVTYGYTFEEIEPEIIGFFQLGYDVHIYINIFSFQMQMITFEMQISFANIAKS